MNIFHLGTSKLRLFFLLFLFLFCSLQGQENLTSRLFLDLPADTVLIQPDSSLDSLKLPHNFLVPGSEKIFRNNFRLFPGIHYFLDNRLGTVNFVRPVSADDSLTIIYQKFPFPFLPEYFHRRIQTNVAVDTADTSRQTLGKVVRNRFLDEIDAYGSNLEKSGSIVRGIEIGTNRDLTLNSGLNLQLSGYITPEVQVVAALTDESTPIQPEGNTQTLREVDKVFVKINSPHIGGTLGDFNLSYLNSDFGNVNRKLQGITVQGELRQFNQQLTYATSRGTFHTFEFRGQEGNQGPYQLVGKNGERDIIVLAGTEQVYVNGELQVRGENNDYIIDYSLGQITFTNNRLITGEDRIEVDFEYSNNFQRYGKTFIGFSSYNINTGPGFSYDLRLFREWDDTNNLLEDSSPLTGEEKAVLEKAGDNPLEASVSGADSVGTGNGNYVKRDTLIGQNQYEYYHYRGDGNGNYKVRFSSVGRGNGDYVRERLGIYRYLGPGLGDFLPIRLIPLAGQKTLADLTFRYQIGRNFNLAGEGAVSLFDQNIFSPVNDNNNTGNAFKLGMNYSSDRAKFLGKNMGMVSWQLGWNKKVKEFSPLDRQFIPEFNYKWNLTGTTLDNDENIVESRLNYIPWKNLELNFDGGIIGRGEDISSRRVRAELDARDSSTVKTVLFHEWINSKSFGQESDWQRTGGLLGRKINRFFPYISYNQEDRTVSNVKPSVTGFYFQSGEAGLKISSLFRIRWYARSLIREDYLYDPLEKNRRQKLSRAHTHSLDGAFVETKNWQGKLGFVYREKNYESFFKTIPEDSIPIWQSDPQFQDTSWVDSRSHLGRIELQFNNDARTIDSRWQYRVASELQILQEKVFVFVGENRGNYRFDQELNEYVPDPQGDYILVILPAGSSEPVTNLEASWQVRYRPRNENNTYSGIENVLRNISFYSSLRVNEKSRESDVFQIYVLNFQKFNNIRTTLRGSYVMDQDIYFFERNPNFGITLRSRFRENLSNEFVQAGFNERLQNWDRSVIWRQSLITRKLTQELQYQNSLIKRAVEAVPGRNRYISGHIGSVSYNYRPVYAWQIQAGIEGGFQEDSAPQNQLQVRYFEFTPQLNYAVAGKARVQLNTGVIHVKILENPFNRPIPFEMAKGKRQGFSYQLNLRFEYFVSTNITTTFNLTGRKDAGAVRNIFLGQAEIRAFF
ncbi:MAG: hypothetical protein EH225_06180 [Calditrichaeota bacterium]|nr:hypothetical protein [Calditrichota bacterium]RQW04222.1 MAG: hypothetical protein EH225_06180 [Calditrichota bacterium]